MSRPQSPAEPERQTPTEVMDRWRSYFRPCGVSLSEAISETPENVLRQIDWKRGESFTRFMGSCAKSLWKQWGLLNRSARPAGMITRNLSDFPLEALFECVERGSYPPPQVLLACFELWERYLHIEETEAGKGLELAFFGPLTPGLGGHSARVRKELRQPGRIINRVLFIHDRVHAACQEIAELENKTQLNKFVKENAPKWAADYNLKFNETNDWDRLETDFKAKARRQVMELRPDLYPDESDS